MVIAGEYFAMWQSKIWNGQDAAFDRLTRSLADFAKLVELFDAHGVSFVAPLKYKFAIGITLASLRSLMTEVVGAALCAPSTTTRSCRVFLEAARSDPYAESP